MLKPAIDIKYVNIGNLCDNSRLLIIFHQISLIQAPPLIRNMILYHSYTSCVMYSDWVYGRAQSNGL